MRTSQGRTRRNRAALADANGAPARATAPRSPFAVRLSPRRGLTLAEVLISMGILAIGLLGVAALFPVGGRYMQTGDIADRAGAIAQAALDDAIIRGHLDPENWVVHSTSAFPMRFAHLLTGDGLGPPHRGLRDTLTESVAFRSSTHGGAFVIDPLGFAGILEATDNNGPFVSPVLSTPIRSFPAIATGADYSTGDPRWTSWASTFLWPVRRVTTVHDVLGVTGRSLNAAGTPPPAFVSCKTPAEAAFTASDDLAQILPEGGDDPSRSRWAAWNDGGAERTVARQARGDFSWLISVSPGSSTARDALATAPDAHPYDVSVVVFHKRALGVGLDGAREAERLVNARVVTTGTAGGELLLTRRPSSEDPVNDSPFEDLRAGEYVMLVGPHPLSTAARPQLFLQWYRVLTIEDSGAPELPGLSATQRQLDGDGDDARVLVSLRGPDWPWQESGDLSDNALLSNDLRVAIIPGAVAVHTKTMRLESGTPWSVE